MREETRLTEDVTTVAANIEKFHAGFSATLLGLEEDGLVVLACGARLVRPWELESGKILSATAIHEGRKCAVCCVLCSAGVLGMMCKSS
jgi:hypothetical protein